MTPRQRATFGHSYRVRAFGGGFIAYCPELDVHGVGVTILTAVATLRAAIERAPRAAGQHGARRGARTEVSGPSLGGAE